MKITLLLLLLILSTSCSSAPLRSHDNRRYRIVWPNAEFDYCVKYKWLRSKITQNCVQWEQIKIDMRDENAFKDLFKSGWIIIKENRVL